MCNGRCANVKHRHLTGIGEGATRRGICLNAYRRRRECTRRGEKKITGARAAREGGKIKNSAMSSSSLNFPGYYSREEKPPPSHCLPTGRRRRKPYAGDADSP